jgi:hypothetical protein
MKMDYGEYHIDNLDSVLFQIGVTRGRETGREEGREEAIQEGLQKGEQIGLQKAVLRLAAQRYPRAATDSIGDKVRSIHDPDVLLSLLDNIGLSASFQAFEHEVDIILKG